MSERSARRWADAAEYLRFRTWIVEPSTDARVRVIDGPAAWASLVAEYPVDTTDLHQSLWGWELPGRVVPPVPAELLRGGGPSILRRGEGIRLILPDWEKVSADFDGVQVTWWGVVTAEGVMSELDGTSVTILRVGGAARTIWLNPVLVPIAPAAEVKGLEGFSPSSDDAADERWLRGRISPAPAF